MNDVMYLLNGVNSMFPSANLKQTDILSSWSGLRPLIHEDGKSPSELSRKDEVFISSSGLISIAGGKLTGYRLMAKKVVDLVCEKLNLQQECRTENVKLIGGDFKHIDLVENYIRSLRARMKGNGLPEEETEYLVRTFGKQSDIILDKCRAFEEEELVQALAWFCLRNEQVSTLSDFYIRRTGYLYFRPGKVNATMELVIPAFAKFLNWDQDRIVSERATMTSRLSEITNFSNGEA